MVEEYVVIIGELENLSVGKAEGKRGDLVSFVEITNYFPIIFTPRKYQHI